MTDGHATSNRVRLWLAHGLMLAGAWIDPTREASMREVRKALGRKRI